MDNVIINYSDWFGDDGGFERIKNDFKKLGSELIKEAKFIRENINLFDMTNNDGIAQYEKRVQELSTTFTEYQKAKKNLTKIEDDYQKTQKKSLQATKLQSKNLAELEQQLGQYRLDLKQVNIEQKLGNKTEKESAEIRADLKLKIKAVNKEIGIQQKEIIESNRLSKQEEKILKANLVLQKERAETIEEIRERLSALRIVASQVNITTDEGKQKVAEYNAEIDELTMQLEENSDKFIQNKINVGNYEEAITNALGSTGLFSTQIGVLDNSLNSLIGILTLNKEQLEEMEKNLGKNTNAVQRFAIGFGKLNKVLKASIIGAVLIAVAALGSIFGNTRSGSIKLEKAMQTLSSVIVTVGKVAEETATSVIGFFKSAFETISNFSLKDLITGKIKFSDLFGGDDDEKETEGFFKRISDIIKNGADAVVDGFENIDRAFRLEDRVRRLNQELEKLNGELARTELISDDSTRSFAEQLDANRKSLSLTEEIGRKRREIARAQLEAINERVKQNIKVNSEELKNIDISKTGQSFAKATLDLAQRRGSQLKISNDLIDEQQNALLELQTVENELQLTRDENAKKRREIERDLFEQNLDLLIDVIDVEKNLSEQAVTDVNKRFSDRVIEFNRFVKKFQKNAQTELDEFTKFAKKSGKDLDFDVKFNPDGSFDVFVNNTRLPIDNIKQLNEELQKLGLAEIPINRFREFIVETGNGVRDFKKLNDELTLTKIRVDELKANLGVGEDELKELQELEKRIKELTTITDFNLLTQKERNAIEKELEDLEKRKTEIQENGEKQRQQNRLKAIQAELDLRKTIVEDGIEKEVFAVERGSERYYQLLQERNDIQKEISEQNAKDVADAVKKSNDLATERWKKFQQEIRQIVSLVFNKVTEVGQKSIDEQEKKIERTENRLDEQRRRAEQGLSNTLAFEQRERAKQEGELIKRQKRLERLEKIKSLWTSYSNYADKEKNPDQALIKTLRDFAILESITASFEDGGIVGKDGYSHVRTNSKGVTMGRSHNLRGGVLAYHQGGEGFWSRQEVANIGEDNFYWLKRMAGMGALDKNFFTPQNTDFTSSIATIGYSDPKIVTELRGVKTAIENKPSQEVDLPAVVDGVMKFTETITTKNKKRRNTYIIKKPRL